MIIDAYIHINIHINIYIYIHAHMHHWMHSSCSCDRPEVRTPSEHCSQNNRYQTETGTLRHFVKIKVEHDKSSNKMWIKIMVESTWMCFK